MRKRLKIHFYKPSRRDKGYWKYLASLRQWNNSYSNICSTEKSVCSWWLKKFKRLPTINTKGFTATYRYYSTMVTTCKWIVLSVSAMNLGKFAERFAFDERYLTVLDIKMSCRLVEKIYLNVRTCDIFFEWSLVSFYIIRHFDWFLHRRWTGKLSYRKRTKLHHSCLNGSDKNPFLLLRSKRRRPIMNE